MIPFAPPRIDDEIIEAVTAVLKSGWITTGPTTKRFEKEIEHYLDAEKVICLNSATAGMELVLRWFGVGPGDEVILPAYTYCSTANVVLHCGATPVFVDSSDDFTIDIDAIKEKLSPRTKAIMPVDIGGWPCDYNALREIVHHPKAVGEFFPNNENQRRLGRPLLLADSAHSFGAEYNKRKLALETDFASYSFHAVKNLTTAEGGAVVINPPKEFDKEEIYRWFNTASLHGQSRDAMAKFKGGSWKYDVTIAGYKCNMPDVLAAIGSVELGRYEYDTLDKRRAVFEFYNKFFAAKEYAICPRISNGERSSSCHVYMLRIADINEQQRDEIIKIISQNDVSVNVHFQPLPLFTAYRDIAKIDDFPNAYKLYAAEISLPVFYDLTNEQMQTVVDTVDRAVNLVLSD